eukprot:GILJ01007724.1.p1 GENE.GILJ01007724.1~~GILJ01007724.1.p1  ORF type:complete len:227 (-),score=29.12 GILJ01007724.1:98-778(-)
MNHEDALTIGVLALQGAFREHIKKLEALGCHAVEVRRAEQLEGLDGLILPGGESTAMGIIAERWGLVEPLRKWVRVDKKPTWGTCAGLILLADKAIGTKQNGQTLIGGLDVCVHRNFFGSQLQSFELPLTAPITSDSHLEDFPAVFIRAPAVIETGAGVEVLTSTPITDAQRKQHADVLQGDDVVVAVKQDHLLGTAFHPELTHDNRWHRYFVEFVRSRKAKLTQT